MTEIKEPMTSEEWVGGGQHDEGQAPRPSAAASSSASVPHLERIPRDDDDLIDDDGEGGPGNIRSSAQNLIPPGVSAGWNEIARAASTKWEEVNHSDGMEKFKHNMEPAKVKVAEGWDILRKNVESGWKWTAGKIEEAKPHVQEWAKKIEKDTKWVANHTLGDGKGERWPPEQARSGNAAGEQPSISDSFDHGEGSAGGGGVIPPRPPSTSL